VAHHKSAIKRIRRNERANVQNSQYLSTVRSAVKKFRAAVASAQAGTTGKEALAPLFVTAQSLLSKAATKGLLHKNNALRKVSRLSKLLKTAETGAKEAAPAKAAKKASPAAKKAPAAAKKAAPKAKSKK
jgi:small subunit ribosomal protein S20